MFTTIEQVEEITGYEVTNEQILRAQAIIESVCGRTEAEVSGSEDLITLARATAFQTAYMKDNYEKVYEQVAYSYKAQSDAAMTLDTSMNAPFLAPLAVLAMRRLSWARSRSVKVGSTFGGPVGSVSWEVD